MHDPSEGESLSGFPRETSASQWETCSGGALRVLPAGTRWEERNKATIRGFRWRPRDADHTAIGKRPFPSIFGRDRLPLKRQEARSMRRREFIAGATIQGCFMNQEG